MHTNPSRKSLPPLLWYLGGQAKRGLVIWAQISPKLGGGAFHWVVVALGLIKCKYTTTKPMAVDNGPGKKLWKGPASCTTNTKFHGSKRCPKFWTASMTRQWIWYCPFTKFCLDDQGLWREDAKNFVVRMKDIENKVAAFPNRRYQ